MPDRSAAVITIVSWFSVSNEAMVCLQIVFFSNVVTTPASNKIGVRLVCPEAKAKVFAASTMTMKSPRASNKVSSGFRFNLSAVYGILCKRVFCLMRQHAIFELNREAVQGSFPVMNGHGPFPANVV